MSSLLVSVSNLLILEAGPHMLWADYFSEYEVYEKFYVAGLINACFLDQHQLPHDQEIGRNYEILY